MKNNEQLSELIDGPWWASFVVEALEALRTRDINSAIESLEALLPDWSILEEEEEEEERNEITWDQMTEEEKDAFVRYEEMN